MELGESETLCIEDNHHGGIGYIDAHFDDGSGYKDLCLATDEALHLFLLVFGLHTTVYLTKTELGKGLFQDFKSVFKVLEVALRTLFYQGEHDIYLPP